VIYSANIRGTVIALGEIWIDGEARTAVRNYAKKETKS